MLHFPIRIRHAPQFVKQLIERSWVLRRPAPVKQNFHLCFFSCQSYFRYLYCSLHSLVTHAQNINLKIIIFSDEEMPLSCAQIDAIQLLVPGAKVLPWPKSMGWGATQISWIWRAYKFAADGATDNDYIVRVDSDVFFFNDRIFHAVARSDTDLVGDGHFVDFKYSQGGCYFFRASAVHTIAEMIETHTIEALLTEVDIVVEDIVAFHFAKRLGLKTWLTWFMMFPDELRNAGSLNSWQRWKFSCLHFVMKNKAAMLEAYVNLELSADEYESFKKIISTQ